MEEKEKNPTKKLDLTDERWKEINKDKMDLDTSLTLKGMGVFLHEFYRMYKSKVSKEEIMKIVDKIKKGFLK
jgi:hypothetical protein